MFQPLITEHILQREHDLRLREAAYRRLVREAKAGQRHRQNQTNAVRHESYAVTLTPPDDLHLLHPPQATRSLLTAREGRRDSPRSPDFGLWDGDLFSVRERAALSFQRWLVQSGRLAP